MQKKSYFSDYPTDSNFLTESSGVETSPELNSSFEHSFPKMPIRRSVAQGCPGLEDSSDEMAEKIQPRKLRFNFDDCDDSDGESTTVTRTKSTVPDATKSLAHANKSRMTMFSMMKSPKKVAMLVKSISEPAAITMSPPYRKVRALRLFDSPATPKTIIQKSATTKTPLVSSSSKHLKFLATNNNCGKSGQKGELLAVPMEGTVNSMRFSSDVFSDTKTGKFLKNRLSLANVNPFTPPSLMMRNKKRSRQEEELNNSLPTYTFGANRNFLRNSATPAVLKSSFASCCNDEFPDDVKQAPKRLALQDTNISRYDKEFAERELIGAGEFGLVYQCVNRLDGCTYAVKRSRKPVAGSTFE